jgi:hypothetical protein
MKPSVHIGTDGALLVEWITKDCRFYLAIEKDLKGSSWGYLSKCKKQLHEFGELPEELLFALQHGHQKFVAEKVEIPCKENQWLCEIHHYLMSDGKCTCPEEKEKL